MSNISRTVKMTLRLETKVKKCFVASLLEGRKRN